MIVHIKEDTLTGRTQSVSLTAETFEDEKFLTRVQQAIESGKGKLTASTPNNKSSWLPQKVN